jgi:hypothetical protein
MHSLPIEKRKANGARPLRWLLFGFTGLAVLASLHGLLRPGLSRAQERGTTGPAFAPGGAPAAGSPGQTADDLLRAYLVTKDQGPWMICVHSYMGPEAPQMAREFVEELRTTYKLPAYVFNYGAEARRKEEERVAKLVQQQREYLQQINAIPSTPIRVKRMRIEEQCAVLVGGYKDDATARRALEGIKKLKQPDAKKIKMDVACLSNPLTQTVEQAVINPFQHSFVVRNPAVPAERPVVEKTAPDPFWKQLNADEPYSVYKCPKPVTLAIKQFQGAAVVQPKSATSAFLSKLGFGGRDGEMLNAAAMNAHNLADVLRKGGLEAYVLHTRYNSIVTVGAFDGPEDPRLKRMQHQIASAGQLEYLQLFAQPMPMEVPKH